MWRYAPYFIIAGLFAMILLGWCVYYWRHRRDTLDDQEFEREVMDHEKKMGRGDDA